MAAPRNMDELTSIIATNTATYTKFLQSQKLPLPSHDPIPQVPPGGPPPLPVEVAAARQAALEATDELHRLLLGPVEGLINIGAASYEIVALDFVVQHRIYDKFAVHTTTTYKALAESCKLDEGDVSRMMRFAMAQNLFRETAEGAVAHTLATQMLQANPLLQAWVGVLTEEFWRAAPLVVDTMRKFPGSPHPVETAYCRANNFTDDLWVEWPKIPGRVERFVDAMKFFQLDPSMSSRHLVEHYDFASLPDRAVVVDLGGSTGALCVAMAQAFPKLRFVVQDRSEVIENREKLDSELESRIDFLAHDFFNDQPTLNADLYIFRCVIHDWSQEYGARILRALIPALKPGARIVINDNLLPPRSSIPKGLERVLRTRDITMKAMTNGLERHHEEWEQLFKLADPRFNFRGIQQPPGSALAIIEAVWEG